MESLLVNGKEYQLIKLLGHGKSGYSYLATSQGALVVVKQIHHEPCSYYTFGNKIQAERCDYAKLCAAGIRVPKLLDIDEQTERIVKEFVQGETVFEMVKNNLPVGNCLQQVRQMAQQAQSAGLNIDYFPTNFVLQEGLLYYVDYECNAYSEQWNFENWGKKYWSRTEEFEDYLRNHQN